MRIGTRVETEEGRMGTTASEPKIGKDWFWNVAVKFDDGAEEIVPEFDLTPVATVDAKALRFGIEAHAAGWSALARNAASDKALAIVSARNDISKNEIVLYFRNGRYDYASSYAVKNGRRIKVRNVSEAKRLLCSL